MHNRSVVRSIEILDMISRSPSGLSLTEVVEATNIPRTTVYEILCMLESTQMLQTIGGSVKKWAVGLRAFRIGRRYMANMDLVRESAPFLESIRDEFGMTSFLAVREQTQVVFLDKREPSNVAIHTADVTDRQDVYCTALGKASMAWLPPETLESLLPRLQFHPRTRRTIVSAERLKAELRKTRKRGYAIDNREILDFVQCVAAPVFNHDDDVIAAISIAGPADRHRKLSIEGQRLRRITDELSGRLGAAYMRLKEIGFNQTA
ncbi:MAG: IclR family transcriptional regulator [Spirochaetaceae bacterium]|nr:IclR family transcriptional regulator [Spirochaetaceae bacterium]MDT8296954.1 IclR family transcriptional regulator [Spirochaetaceae bacterium]